MWENIRLSFQGIWSHKMRSFLTMLGIIIGIASIIAIVSTIQGTNKQIEQNLIGSGNNTINIQLYQNDWTLDLSYQEVPSGIPLVSEETYQQLADLHHVDALSLYRSRQNYDMIYYQNTLLSGGYVYGVDDGYFNTAGLRIGKGRGFSENDLTQSKKVCLLDENAAKSLFMGENAVGKVIEIRKEPFLVIGMVEEKNSFEPVINSIEDYYTYVGDQSGKVYLPETVWPILFQYDEPQSILLKVESTNDMTTVGKQAADILNATLSVSDSTIKYKAQDLMEQAKQIQQLSASTNQMLLWIAGISLLVGGIGVMNIMLVSVTERTNEIGLKKAIGAKKSCILGQFLTESVVLTSLGGVFGVIVGIILSGIISKTNNIPMEISVPAVIFAIVFSMAIGIIFGMIPSYQASNLDPIEALRHE